MRILLQRIASAQVTWSGGATAQVGAGLLGLVGLHGADAPYLLEPMADKLVHLRVFEDKAGRMNRSLPETGGALVLVPQFTLYADCRRGRRPSFSSAMAPDAASALYERFVALCRDRVPSVETGSFGAYMQVQLINDGPVTILLDSDELGLTRP